MRNQIPATEADLADLHAGAALYLARGRLIKVVVIGRGYECGTVVVSQEVPASHVELRLTAEQVAALALAQGQEYRIEGTVRDGAGRLMSFPSTLMHTIPARWLWRMELDPSLHRRL